MKIKFNIINGGSIIKAGEYAKGKLTDEEIKVCASLGAIEDEPKPKTKEKPAKASKETTNAEPVTITLDQIIAEIESKDLETELDLLLSEIEMEGLTDDEIALINAAAEKCREQIRAGAKG